MDDLNITKPVACTLTPALQRAETKRLKADLAPLVLSRTRLDDGTRLTFSIATGVREKIDLLVEMDKGCCTFLEHQVESNDRTITLTVRSQGEGIALAQEFLEDLAPTKEGKRRDMTSKMALLIGIGCLACLMPILLGVAGLGVVGVGFSAMGFEFVFFGLVAIGYAAYLYVSKRNAKLKEKENNADRCGC